MTMKRRQKNHRQMRELKVCKLQPILLHTCESTEHMLNSALMSQLISNPDSDDVLLYAVPMVGPYQVSFDKLLLLFFSHTSLLLQA